MKKILIADDEKSFLLSLRDGMSTHSDKFQILTAENGREAVAVLRSQPIDLLVTDLKMPEMNGFELLAWTSRHQPQLAVIVMSAFGTPEIETRLAKMDTLQFLEKPLDIQMLEEAIFNGLNAGGKSFIRGITLATFLQLMKVEKKNCTLKTSKSERTAYLYVRRGELIDAQLGDQAGLEAALEVVGWDDAEIEMDGICRRQEDAIQLPMEHLLIEAFKRKDEAAELEKSGFVDVDERVSGFLDGLSKEETPVEIPESVAHKQLEAVLARLVPVQEYAIFDEKGAPVSKNPGKCSLDGIDPAVFDYLLASLAVDLNFGVYSFVTFNSASRNRYLLFQNQQYCVLAKLKPGTQSQLVMKEVERQSQC
ncbi:MAG: response regulator [Desulfuromusa sp.]|jgi:DNA-binding NarL/FixJ family response regulator|nr:response regulator [Desulfuromusa sp.]